MTRTVSLSQLCGCLSSMVAPTETRSDPQLACQGSAHVQHGEVPLFYRLHGDPPSKLRRLTHEDWRPAGRLQVTELQFSVPCHVDPRRTGTGCAALLRLQAPAWWRRLFNRYPTFVLSICVLPTETGVVLQSMPSVDLPVCAAGWAIALAQAQLATLEKGDRVVFTQKPSC